MPFTDYQAFARANLRFLVFGFLTAFTSSAGQTFFIGVFGPEIRETFSLAHTEWGTIYLIGTLCSALALTWTGSLIDRFDLRLFAACAIGGLAVACFVISITISSCFVSSACIYGVHVYLWP